MLQQIEECCSLGAHAAVIIPPTWIIRVRRPQVRELSQEGKAIMMVQMCPTAVDAFVSLSADVSEVQ